VMIMVRKVRMVRAGCTCRLLSVFMMTTRHLYKYS
jgi:hypothetical protein